jgi:hypothetical protein
MNAKRSMRLWAAVCLIGCGAWVSRADTHFVAHNGQIPAGTFTDWGSAASNIQEAIDVASDGDGVLVGDGVYDVGGRTQGGGALTSRVVIAKAITVQSANNSPATTTIKGAWDNATTTNGPAAVRCVWMSAGALIGFTVTNGATFAGPAIAADVRGGGVYCDLTVTPVISNCVITGNAAGDSSNHGSGGGVFCGTVNNCTIIGNTATGVQGAGGGIAGTTDGGNIYGSANHCVIIGNTAQLGGAAHHSNMSNC